MILYYFSAPIILIGFTSRKKLFCSSNDLLESFQDETAFCTIIGISKTIVTVVSLAIIIMGDILYFQGWFCTHFSIIIAWEHMQWAYSVL